jgi:hypothetical protein
VDPVPDPLLLRKSGSAGNRTRASGSAARNSDYYTTEAGYFLLHNIYKFSSYFAGNRIHLRSVVRNSDHYTTDNAVGISKSKKKCNDVIGFDPASIRLVA